MGTVPTVCLGLQDWWVSWFGETNAIQWLGLFLSFIFAAAVGAAIYLSALRGHLAANRYPSALRFFCLMLGVAVALGCFTLLFYGAFIYYVSAALLLISLIVAAVFFISSRKVATKS